MLAVIDTNILVSALWSKNGSPARVISMMITGEIVLCYDYRIMCEYKEVLQRPKFGFSKGEIDYLLDWFKAHGHSVQVKQSNIAFLDEADRKFYDVAKACGAVLITGNMKHFPKNSQIISVSEFLRKHFI